MKICTAPQDSRRLSRDVMTGREDVIRVILCAAYMLLLTYLEKDVAQTTPREVVRGFGGPAGP